MFELVHVSRSFASQVALDDVTLRIEAGRTTMLIGPSGCGKSTLLRLLIGLLAPSRGQVAVRRWVRWWGQAAMASPSSVASASTIPR